MKSGQISIIVYAQLSSVAIIQNLFFFLLFQNCHALRNILTSKHVLCDILPFDLANEFKNLGCPQVKT